METLQKSNLLLLRWGGDNWYFATNTLVGVCSWCSSVTCISPAGLLSETGDWQAWTTGIHLFGYSKWLMCHWVISLPYNLIQFMPLDILSTLFLIQSLLRLISLCIHHVLCKQLFKKCTICSCSIVCIFFQLIFIEQIRCVWHCDYLQKKSSG